jgi:hypothetical protein
MSRLVEARFDATLASIPRPPRDYTRYLDDAVAASTIVYSV